MAAHRPSPTQENSYCRGVPMCAPEDASQVGKIYGVSISGSLRNGLIVALAIPLLGR